MTTLRINLTPAEIDALAAEAAGAGAESVPEYVAGLLRARWEREETEQETPCATCENDNGCWKYVSRPLGFCGSWKERSA